MKKAELTREAEQGLTLCPLPLIRHEWKTLLRICPAMKGKPINLTCEEAEELAFQSPQDDAESLVLLLEGIKEHKPLAAEMLIISAVNKVFCLTNGYNAMKADYLQSIVQKLKQK